MEVPILCRKLTFCTIKASEEITSEDIRVMESQSIGKLSCPGIIPDPKSVRSDLQDTTQKVNAKNKNNGAE